MRKLKPATKSCPALKQYKSNITSVSDTELWMAWNVLRVLDIKLLVASNYFKIQRLWYLALKWMAWALFPSTIVLGRQGFRGYTWLRLSMPDYLVSDFASLSLQGFRYSISFTLHSATSSSLWETRNDRAPYCCKRVVYSGQFVTQGRCCSQQDLNKTAKRLIEWLYSCPSISRLWVDPDCSQCNKELSSISQIT